MASISRMAGRQGIRIRTETLAASNAALSECGAVSRNRISPPVSSTRCISWCKRLACAERTTGNSVSRRSDHFVAEACGSRSITAVLRCSEMEATAKCKARGSFPEPPFWLMTETVFIMLHTFIKPHRNRNEECVH